MRALVSTVLPCLKSVVLPSNFAVSMPAVRAASSTASMTPREKSSGVVEALAVQTSPALLNTTTSVNVPPVSTPIMYCAFDAMQSLPLCTTIVSGCRSLPKFSDGRSAFDEILSHHEDHEDHEGFGYFHYKLRALRVLRGQTCFFFFGCGSVALRLLVEV